MTTMNRTHPTEFILVGFSNSFRVNICLFFLFLVIYLVTIIGNVLLMILILRNPNLHTRMYFFLCVLSFMDLCESSSVVPRLLVDLLSTRRVISYAACTVQFYLILYMSGTEYLLLAVMAYDRYIAICRPLHYPILMRWSMCYRLIALMFIVSFMILIVPCLLTPDNLCNQNRINHFMCEIISIMHLSCNDTYFSEILMLLISLCSLLLPFTFITVSYACIISSILRIHSTKRSKAFSTCTSHITVVVLFYGTAMLVYFSPVSHPSAEHGKYLSVFFNIICPSLNPLIYSLNNKDVKEAIQKMFHKNQTNVHSIAQ